MIARIVICLAGFGLVFFGAGGLLQIVLKLDQREASRAAAGFLLVIIGIAMVLYVLAERTTR